mgnify:CR=1 FL=1
MIKETRNPLALAEGGIVFFSSLTIYGEIVSATEVLTPKKSACGWDCKTCKKEFCSLIQAGSCETSKIVTSNNLVIQVTSPCLQAVGS